MGKKNKKLQPQKTPVAGSEKQERKCDWCHQPSVSGSLLTALGGGSDWVCDTCFPQEAVSKKKEAALIVVRKCDSCRDKTNEGVNLLGRWICHSCSRFFDKTTKQHNNKYAQFSNVDRNVNPKHVEVIKSSNKKKRKERKPKLVKIEYWKVIITDISDGTL